MKKVIGIVLINISTSNIFLTMLLFAGFYQICQVVFGRCEYQWVIHDAMQIRELV